MTSIRDFVPLSKLGQGSFSTVYKVRRLSDQQIYALKKVKMNNLSTKQKQNALNEVRILASIESQFIVGYKQAFFDQKLNLLCIVMQFADGGDLQNLITQTRRNKCSIDQKQIWKAANDILEGLIILHSKGILHRDLKSANIFLQNGKFKLGDLNVSKVNGGNLAHTQTGTPYYASPQVWRDQPYGPKSDIWSFGCIIYQMIALKPPFNGNDLEELYKSVQKTPFAPLPYSCSKQLQQLIKLTLEKNQKIRKSAKQLLTYHKFHKFYPNNSDYIFDIQKSQPSNKQLLKTIKLPADLKSLQKNLPNSKYQSDLIRNQEAKLKESQIVKMRIISLDKKEHYHSDRPIILKKDQSLVSELKQRHQNLNIKNQGMLKNNSQVCMKSPKTSKKVENFSTPNRVQTHSQHKKIFQNPFIRLSEKKVNLQNPVQYSQRILNSDSKRNGRNINSHARNVIDKYLKDYQQKRPITSIPRTQKQTIFNKSALSNNKIEKQGQLYEDLKNRLVKKSRVASNKYPKPSWWG